jgi:ComF family protein
MSLASPAVWLSGLTDFALPQRCPGCGAPGARCLAAGREPWGCRRHRAFAVFAAWVYDERAAAVVHALKYGDRPALATPLGDALAAAVPGAWRRPDLVLEVPLHAARMRERGYNQASLLADTLAESLGAPRLEAALRRTRATRPQAKLGESARRANVAGAFEVTGARRLAGRRVLVVDDVMTTGATLEACLAALDGAGAKAAGVALAWAQ